MPGWMIPSRMMTVRLGEEEHLLCGGPCARLWEWSTEQGKVPILMELIF